MAIETLGQRIRERRLLSSLSQEDLSAVVDVSKNVVSLWENGRSTPRTDHCVALAKALGVSLSWLITGTDEVAAASADDEAA